MRKTTLIFALLIMTILSLLIVVQAAFQLNNESEITLSKKDYELEMKVMLDNVEINKTNSPYYDSTKGVYVIDASTHSFLNSPNSISKLTVYVKIKAKTATRFRVQVEDEWVSRRYYRETGRTSEFLYSKDAFNGAMNAFNYDSQFFKNSSNPAETWYYCNRIANNNETIEALFINGGTIITPATSDVFDETIYININFRFEAVQANRFQEVWRVPANLFG